MSNIDDDREPPAGKTEWEDILIKHNIISAPAEAADEDDIWTEQVIKKQDDDKANPFRQHEGKSLEQLKKLEDDIPEDSLEALRKKRIAELKAIAARNKFGDVQRIGEAEWVKEVTQEAKDVWVVVHLMVHGKTECILLDRIFKELAAKFRDVKFVVIEGNKAIRNYPDANCPTMLIYKGGEIKLQMVGLMEIGGPKASVATLEWTLSKIGVLKTDMTESPMEDINRQKVKRLEKARKQFEDEGDDWLND